mgnify:CR=1 FL=1
MFCLISVFYESDPQQNIKPLTLSPRTTSLQGGSPGKKKNKAGGVDEALGYVSQRNLDGPFPLTSHISASLAGACPSHVCSAPSG